jgi:hypothetical protein
MRPDITANLAEMWDHLARPGATWTGAERVAIAAEARMARGGEGPGGDLSPPATEAAGLLAARPARVRRGWVTEIVESGVGYERYVELVGIVSRVTAADTFSEALGLDRHPLPQPVAGEPTGDTDDRARLGAAWVPMVGGASITQALSLVPSENAELERFHGPMYMTFGEMSNPHFTRGMTRVQMELVAARTSAINECFY